MLLAHVLGVAVMRWHVLGTDVKRCVEKVGRLIPLLMNCPQKRIFHPRRFGAMRCDRMRCLPPPADQLTSGSIVGIHRGGGTRRPRVACNSRLSLNNHIPGPLALTSWSSCAGAYRNEGWRFAFSRARRRGQSLHLLAGAKGGVEVEDRRPMVEQNNCQTGAKIGPRFLQGTGDDWTGGVAVETPERRYGPQSGAPLATTRLVVSSPKTPGS